ncbi:MAG: hypothetical protein ACI4JZ_10115 [Oscillospiraceae bacterium]
MTLLKTISLAAAASLFLTACGSTTSNSGESTEVIESNSETTPFKTVTESFESELNDLKSTPQVNIDWSNAAIGYPLQGISECYAVKLMDAFEVHPEKVLPIEEQLAQFEYYCKIYLGEYNSEFACFDTKNRELSDDDYTIDGIENEVFTAFPKIDEHKEQILNGEVVPVWYLYVDHKRQMYLWWSAESMIYPHWYNKGTALQMLDRYYKASSTIPTDIGEPVAVYPNDGSHNNESYHLLDGDVTVGEALDWFSNDYMKSLGIAENDIEKPAVRQIEVYQITEDTFAYVFHFTPTVNGIPLDYAGERIYRLSQGEKAFNSVTRSGQALMIKSGEIDWAIDISPEMYATEGEPITEIISLKKAADIMSKSVSENVLYKAKTVELVMTADKSAENPDPLLMPTWKITLQNENDGFLYDFYIDAVSGTLGGYLRYDND